MANQVNKTFLGFGLGAIQSGLMLMKAVKSGNFKKYVILEVKERIVAEIRDAGNYVVVNTSTKNGIDKLRIENIEIYNPIDPNDLNKIEDAIYNADEIATAIPSVSFYESGGENSITNLLAKNIIPSKSQILYASENNNCAAELLTGKILKHANKQKLKNFQALNKVIGKMSGVIQDEKTISEFGLDTITENSSSAILVEVLKKNYCFTDKINPLYERYWINPLSTVYPQPENKEKYDERFKLYRKLYKTAKEISL